MAIIRLRPKVSDVSIHDSKLASLEIELLDSREIKSRNDDLILKEEEKKKKFQSISIKFHNYRFVYRQEASNVSIKFYLNRGKSDDVA